MPAVPDFNALDVQQGDLNHQAVNTQTQANRPNQTNPFGSSTWSQDGSGNWSQNVSLNSADQGMLDQSRQTRSGLMAGVQANMSSPMDTSGMTQWGSMNPGGLPGLNTFDNYGDMPDAEFSSVQQVSDAMMGLMQPGLERSRNAEVARLKAQGLTEGSDAWNASMRNLGNNESDAQMKSLLEGSRAANDLYNRRMGNRQQNVNEDIYGNAARGQAFDEQYATANFQDSQRGRQFSEVSALRDRPLQEMAGLQALEQGLSPQFDSFSNASLAEAPDVYGAGKDTYDAKVGQANARNAARSGRIGGLMSLAGTVMGGPAGGMIAGRMFGK
jgi:hypothetical protein